MDKIIAVFPKNKFQEVRVGVREFKGNDLIDIRIWTQTQGAKEMVATAKGVAINVALLPQLMNSLKEVEKVLNEARASYGND